MSSVDVVRADTTVANPSVMFPDHQPAGGATADAARDTPTLAPDAPVNPATSRESFLSANLYDASGLQRLRLEGGLSNRNAAATSRADFVTAQNVTAQNVTAQTIAAPNNFVERYPAAQGLKFSETKSASQLAYGARAGGIYEFPDGKLWRVADVREAPNTSFRAVVLRPTDSADDRVVISYAGTSFNDTKDWDNNLRQGLFGTPAQYQQATDLAREYRAEYGDRVILTGHSLGGGLASHASIQTGAPATAINSAPLSLRNYTPFDRFDPAINRRITHYYAPGEILSDLDSANPTDARPGRQIAVPGRRREVPNIPGPFDDAYNLWASIENHQLHNLATDVPPPRRVSP